MDDQRLQLLLVTPDVALQDAMRDALEELAVGLTLHVAPDPAAATSFLNAEGLYDGAAPPDVVLVDLDHEALWAVFDAVADDPARARVPVVALTGDEAGTSRRLLGHRVHDIMPKPPPAERMRQVLSFLDEA